MMEQNKESVIMEVQENELTEMISINVICRLCANQNDKLIGIYSEDGISNDLANKMNLYLPVKVNETDDLPLQCCWQCASTVLAWHDLVVTSVEADRRLRSYQFVTEKQLEEVQVDFQTEEGILANKQEEFLDKTEEEVKTEEAADVRNEDIVFYNDNISEDEECSFENNNKGFMEDHTEGIINLGKSLPFSNQLTGYESAVNLETNTCKICNKCFINKVALNKHMSGTHNLKKPKYRRKKSEIDATFVCPTCNKSFTRKFDMQKHILKKHPGQKDEVIPSRRYKNLEILEKCTVTSPEGNYYKCDVCGHKFKKSQSLVRHRNIHTSERVYCCHICGKKFLVSNALVRHINQLHYGIRNFNCTICDRKFSSKTTRDEHMNIHTNNRPFVCDVCGKSFKQNSSLHIHKMFHTNVFRFECNVCDKKFRRKRDLKVHHWMHTGEKPHQCKVCKMSFRLGQDLKRHSKTHVEYLCVDCGLKFHQERLLKIHRKYHSI